MANGEKEFENGSESKQTTQMTKRVIIILTLSTMLSIILMITGQDTIAVDDTNQDHLVVQDKVVMVGQHHDNEQDCTTSSLKSCHKKNFFPRKSIGGFIIELCGGIL